MNTAWVKPGLWGLVAGIVIAPIVGFSAGWVETTGTAKQAVADATNQTLVAAYAPVCALRFETSATPAQLAEFNKADSWSRGDVISKTGFATVPGFKDATDDIAGKCADAVSAKLKTADATAGAPKS